MIWEIKCLSRRYPIRVGKRDVRWGEAAVHLRSGDILGVGGESFFFLLPKEDKEPTNIEQEENKALDFIE